MLFFIQQEEATGKLTKPTVSGALQIVHSKDQPVFTKGEVLNLEVFGMRGFETRKLQGSSPSLGGLGNKRKQNQKVLHSFTAQTSGVPSQFNH